jgi:hypothetical protein
MSNVPDDWGMYYHRCHRCGHKYHASEGGCGCMDSLECQCGKGNWDRDEEPRCTSCGTGSYQRGRVHRTKHRARKAYYGVNHSQDILSGDLYERIVTFGHYPGGAFTLSVIRRMLEKGPNWVAKEVMDS